MVRGGPREHERKLPQRNEVRRGGEDLVRGQAPLRRHRGRFVVEDAAAALPKASLEPRKTAVCPKPKDLPDPQSIKTDATIVAPLSSLIKDLPASAAAPSKPEAIKPISPVSPVAPASPLSPAGAPGIRKPIIGGVLKPGLKLPPKPAGLKPGLKLPPKPSFQLKPGLKLPPKPGDAPAQ